MQREEHDFPCYGGAWRSELAKENNSQQRFTSSGDGKENGSQCCGKVRGERREEEKNNCHCHGGGVEKGEKWGEHSVLL